jgi:SAM-dependent methyltransferase
MPDLRRAPTCTFCTSCTFCTRHRAGWVAVLLGLGLLVPYAPSRAAAPPATTPADTTALGRLRQDAANLRPLAHSALARDFLAATADLPYAAPRTIWRDSSRTHAWTDAEAQALPDSTRQHLVRRELDESYYWNTRYGSPLAYVRALDLLAANGVASVRGKRVADFGCGMLGQLSLLARLGADAVGIDVDPVLRALYTGPGDQGEVKDPRGKALGRVRLAIGQWPAEADVRAAVGGGYDLFLSKNTLKNGYLHPAEKVDPRMLVHLGVSDSAYVAALFAAVAPGGRVMIYNLCPAPAAAGKPYIPWADGRCPFPPEAWRAAGFRVLVFDRDDSPQARAMGHALGWDQGGPAAGGMDLEHDLFATWSLFERPLR